MCHKCFMVFTLSRDANNVVNGSHGRSALWGGDWVDRRQTLLTMKIIRRWKIVRGKLPIAHGGGFATRTSHPSYESWMWGRSGRVLPPLGLVLLYTGTNLVLFVCMMWHETCCASERRTTDLLRFVIIWLCVWQWNEKTLHDVSAFHWLISCHSSDWYEPNCRVRSCVWNGDKRYPELRVSFPFLLSAVCCGRIACCCCIEPFRYGSIVYTDHARKR
jgi:hypothetical protein